MPNFGDGLTPWLIRAITGRYPVFTRPGDEQFKHIVVGSVLGYCDARCVVWGAGILKRSDVINPKATLLAVRGPLSRTRARECGCTCPKVYGDPALLLPFFYEPRVDRRAGLGIVAHFSDKPRLLGRGWLTPSVRLIDIQGGIEHVIDAIVSCDAIASSSLHGLIVAAAYGIPSVWVRFAEHALRDDTKFHDFYLACGVGNSSPLVVSARWPKLDEIYHHTAAVVPSLDTAPLWAACPFRR